MTLTDNYKTYVIEEKEDRNDVYRKIMMFNYIQYLSQ